MLGEGDTYVLRLVQKMEERRTAGISADKLHI